MEAVYTPVFKGPIQGWTLKHIQRHFWRVDAIMERKDLIQEAYIVFMRCAAKYPALDQAAHFMSLYQRAWNNHFNDLSNQATQLRSFISVHAEDDEGEVLQIEAVGETENVGFLMMALRQAPEEVRRVITLMLNAPQELVDIVLADWRGHDRRRKDGGGRRINAALGLSPEVDVYQVVCDYLRH